MLENCQRERGTKMLHLFQQVCKRFTENNRSIHHDYQYGSYITKHDDWASFNDVIDIDEKAKWIVEKDLAGASVFLLHHDDFNASCGCETYPLLKTVNRRFARSIEETGSAKNCSLFANVVKSQINRESEKFS